LRSSPTVLVTGPGARRRFWARSTRSPYVPDDAACPPRDSDGLISPARQQVHALPVRSWYAFRAAHNALSPWGDAGPDIGSLLSSGLQVPPIGAGMYHQRPQQRQHESRLRGLPRRRSACRILKNLLQLVEWIAPGRLELAWWDLPAVGCDGRGQRR
jgi:hypothetical protein